MKVYGLKDAAMEMNKIRAVDLLEPSRQQQLCFHFCYKLIRIFIIKSTVLLKTQTIVDKLVKLT